jgi:hypothetical protein
MRDAVSIEHRFGDVYGATGRGHEADADAVRVGKPEYLVKAIDRATRALRKRIEALPDNDQTKIWVEDSIESVENVRDTLKAHKKDDYPMFLLWDLSASLLHLAHLHLEMKGL